MSRPTFCAGSANSTSRSRRPADRPTLGVGPNPGCVALLSDTGQEQAIWGLGNVVRVLSAIRILVLDPRHRRRPKPPGLISTWRAAEHQPAPIRHPENVVRGVIARRTQYHVSGDAGRASGVVADGRPGDDGRCHPHADTQQRGNRSNGEAHENTLAQPSCLEKAV